jgi:hypothetical protein
MIESFTVAEFAVVRSLADDLSGYTLLTRMCDALEQMQRMTAIAAEVLGEDPVAVTRTAREDAHVVVCAYLGDAQLKRERPLAA